MLPAAPPEGASQTVPMLPHARTPPPEKPGSPQAHVLLALPPTATSAAVLRSLRADGVSVSTVGDGIGVLHAVRTRGASLVVLDVELPGPDQSALLSALHREVAYLPVIAVTPRERRAALLRLLRGDRDDYLLRPFAVDELAARIRLRLRAADADETVLRHGDVAVDLEHDSVCVAGRPVSLSPTELAMLKALLETPGQAVAPNRLARRVWSEDASANLVQVYISYLRRKIGSDRIRTVRGVGYVLER